MYTTFTFRNNEFQVLSYSLSRTDVTAKIQGSNGQNLLYILEKLFDYAQEHQEPCVFSLTINDLDGHIQEVFSVILEDYEYIRKDSMSSYWDIRFTRTQLTTSKV